MVRQTDGEMDGWEEGQTERPGFIWPSRRVRGPINNTGHFTLLRVMLYLRGFLYWIYSNTQIYTGFHLKGFEIKLSRSPFKYYNCFFNRGAAETTTKVTIKWNPWITFIVLRCIGNSKIKNQAVQNE